MIKNLALTLAVLLSPALAGAAPFDEPGAESRVDRRLEAMTQGLGLSADQEAQIRAILTDAQAEAARQRAETRARIDAVLTPEQRAKHAEQRDERGQRMVERMTERLGLSAEQQAQMQAILDEKQANPQMDRREVRQRIAGILTPEQREKLAEMRGRRGEGWGGRGPRELPPEL